MTSCPAFTHTPPSVLPILPEPMTPIFNLSPAATAARTVKGNVPRTTAAVPAIFTKSRRLCFPIPFVFIVHLQNNQYKSAAPNGSWYSLRRLALRLPYCTLALCISEPHAERHPYDR